MPESILFTCTVLNSSERSKWLILYIFYIGHMTPQIWGKQHCQRLSDESTDRPPCVIFYMYTGMVGYWKDLIIISCKIQAKTNSYKYKFFE